MPPVPAPTGHRGSVLLAYALFTLVGISAGVTGVLLFAQIRDYGIDRAVFGLTFFTGSSGFLLASTMAGPLIWRWGSRAMLVVGTLTFLVAGLATAVRPAFAVLLVLQFLAGYGTGMLESVLGAYVAALPNSTNRVNRLHAFFGVGALIGPVLATWMLTFTTWPMVWLVMALACVPLTVAVALLYPGRAADPLAAAPVVAGKPRGGLLRMALRMPAAVLGSALLAVYVGLELGVGSWSFSFLVEARSISGLVAGYLVSGYWLGLTLGRFLLSPLASRLGMGAVGLMYSCLAGVVLATAVGSLSLPTAVTAASLVLLGFFLGPIFPTAIAVAPRLAEPALAPTVIGVMNAGSVVGGSALPWLAGAVAQGYGPWTLLPLSVLLALAQLAIWHRMARQMRPH